MTIFITPIKILYHHFNMKSPNQGTKSPIRSRICIKNSKITHHKAPIVPQVRIELDDLLN